MLSGTRTIAALVALLAALALPASAFGIASQREGPTYVGKASGASEMWVRMNVTRRETSTRLERFTFHSTTPHHKIKATWTPHHVWLDRPDDDGTVRFELGHHGPIDWVRGTLDEHGVHGRYSMHGEEGEWRAAHPKYTYQEVQWGKWSGATEQVNGSDSQRYLIEIGDVYQGPLFGRCCFLFLEDFRIRDAETDEVIWRWPAFAIHRGTGSSFSVEHGGRVVSMSGTLESNTSGHGRFKLTNGDVASFYVFPDCLTPEPGSRCE